MSKVGAAPASSPRFFPGWTMVGMAAAAQFMSAPGQSYSVAAFKEPMRESLGVGETSYSFAYAVATIVSGLLVPVVGRLLDRKGARLMLPLLAAALGLACLGMSQVATVPSLYAGFIFVRSLGQGALSLVAAWLVGEWFCRRRGFATALSGLGGSLSVMLIPILNAYVITHYGWQAGWTVLAVAVWTVLMVPSMFLVQNRPEDLGLLPDGDPPLPTPSFAQPKPSSMDAQGLEATPAVEGEPKLADYFFSDSAASDERIGNDDARPSSLQDQPHPPQDARPQGTRDGQSEEAVHDWQVRDVLQDPTFWKLLCVPASSGMIGTGLVFHAVSLLGSRGVPSDKALLLISLQAVVATGAALFVGILTDRCPARHLLAFAMLLLAASSALVQWLPFPAMAILYATLLGLHGSVLRSTGTVVWMDYYGRQHQGAIRGIAMAVMIFAAAVGPLPLALAKDTLGKYDLVLYGFIAVPLLAAALVWSAKEPRGQAAPAD